jgi:CHAD domain-containing protein
MRDIEWRWKNSKTAAENAAKVFPKLVKRYFKAGRAALDKERSWDELHEFRLESKHFRYSLELFRPVYGEALDERLQMLKKLQQILGDINDAVATSQLLKSHSAYDQLRKELDDRAEQKTHKLMEFWRDTFDAPGQLELWEEVLAGEVEAPEPAPELKPVAELREV